MVRDNRRHDRRSFLKLAGSAGAAGMAGLAGCTGGSGDGGGDGGDGGGGDGGGGDGGDGGGGGGGTPEPTPTRTKTEEKKALKIGYMTWLSGPLSTAGDNHRKGAKIALDRINANGGANGHKLEWAVKDSEASPDAAVKRARQLLQQDDADLVTGCTTSASGKALSPFAAGQGVPLLLGATQTPDVTKGECKETTFRPCTNIIHQEVSLAEAIHRMTPDDATRVAGVNPDYVYGHQSWEFFKEEFKARRPDAEFVESTFPAFLKGDYKKEIQALLDAEPDIVQSVLFGGDMVAFIKQAQQFNFFEEVDHFGSGALDTISAALGADMVEAISFNPTHWSYEGTDKVQQWAQEWVDRHNSTPDGWYGAYGHMNIECIRAAVEKTGGISKNDLMDGFADLTFSSVVPDITMRPGDHQGFAKVNLVGKYGPVENDLLPNPDVYGFTDVAEIPASEMKKSDPDECEAF